MTATPSSRWSARALAAYLQSVWRDARRRVTYIVATGKNEKWHQPEKEEIREYSTRPEARRMAAQDTDGDVGRADTSPPCGGKLDGNDWVCCWERWGRQGIAEGDIDEGGIEMQWKERVVWREAIEERKRGCEWKKERKRKRKRERDYMCYALQSPYQLQHPST